MSGRIRLGIVRVITLDGKDSVLLETHGRHIERAYPGVETISVCLPGHPEGVYDRATEEAAASKVPHAARQLEEHGAHAVIVSCCADPGVREAARAVAVPVIGAGRAAALTSLLLELPVGVLGLNLPVPEVMQDVLGDRLVAAAAPRGVRTTLDLLSVEAARACEDAVTGLARQGARAICLACTGTATAGLPDRLACTSGLPVIDPVLAAAGLALTLAAQLAHRGVREQQ